MKKLENKQTINRSLDIARMQNKLDVECLKFSIRNDTKISTRVDELMEANKAIKRARMNTFDETIKY